MSRTSSNTYQHDWSDYSWTTGTPTTALETLSGVTESITGAIDASAFWSMQITVDINYDATPTDDISISVYGSVDGTNWDDTAMDFVAGNKLTDPEQLTFMIFNPPKYIRIGFVQSGSTDSHDISTVHYIGFS